MLDIDLTSTKLGMYASGANWANVVVWADATSVRFARFEARVYSAPSWSPRTGPYARWVSDRMKEYSS